MSMIISYLSKVKHMLFVEITVNNKLINLMCKKFFKRYENIPQKPIKPIEIIGKKNINILCS